MDTQNMLSLVHDSSEAIIVLSNECVTLQLEALGKAGISNTEARIYYGADHDSPHARMTRVALDITVNAALRVHNLDISSSEPSDDALLLHLDIANAFPKTIPYSCAIASTSKTSELSPTSKQTGDLAPGELRRTILRIPPNLIPFNPLATPDSIRTEFLSSVSVTWTLDSRRGRVALDALPLSVEALSLITPKPISLEVTVPEHRPSPSPSSPATPIRVPVDAFVTIRTRLEPRTSTLAGTPLLVRLTPVLGDGGRAERRVVVHGPPQRIVRVGRGDGEGAKDGGAEELDFVLVPLQTGRLEVEVFVRPARIGQYADGKEEWEVRRVVRLDVVRGGNEE